MNSLLTQQIVPVGTCWQRFRLALLLGTLALAWAACGNVHGQEAAKDLADPSLSDADRRSETLVWLDKYMSDSDLAPPGMIDKIRATIDQMTPSQLERWLVQTRRLRNYVESPEWQETKKWLHGFLKVQAVYSQQEIQEFRQRLWEADPDQLLEMLQRIQSKHESMVWLHQAADKERSMAVDARNRAVARQDAINKAAMQAAAARSAPLFGNAMNAGGGGGKPDSGYRIPGPLVNSRMAAAWAVWGGAW